jgi:hypothetical protein
MDTDQEEWIGGLMGRRIYDLRFAIWEHVMRDAKKSKSMSVKAEKPEGVTAQALARTSDVLWVKIFRDFFEGKIGRMGRMGGMQGSKELVG